MTERRNSRKDREVFAALVVAVGSILVGEESERILKDLGDSPEAEFGMDLLAEALTYLRGDPETRQDMAVAGFQNAIRMLNEHFRTKG